MQTHEEMKFGFETLAAWSQNIALLPLEEWQAGFDRAETIAPILDPTLYREYLHSEKAAILRRLIAAALPLKRVVLESQAAVQEQIAAMKG